MRVLRGIWRVGEWIAGAVMLLVGGVLCLLLASAVLGMAGGVVYGIVEQVAGHVERDDRGDRTADRMRRSFCERHRCVTDFYSGEGSIVRCADGVYSHSGGRSGACSHHGGVQGSQYGGDGSRYGITDRDIYGGNPYGS